jgi:hypothetical protein
MRKQVLGLIGAAAFTIGTAANATVTVDDTSFEAIDGPDTTGSTTTIGYTDTDLGNPSFSEWLTFTNDLAGVYSITLSTSSFPVDFTNAILQLVSDGSTVATLTPGFDNGTTEFWQVSGVALGSGQYKLIVEGDNSDTGALEGSVTISAVPEPGTGAMMLLGFGAAGYAMRRRRRPALMQVA